MSGEIHYADAFFLVKRWTDSSLFFDLPSVIRCLHEMCANGIACICFVLAFGLVVVRFTNVNWYAQLICSKVMITEIVEGPYSINNIDLYSNYSGNNIVSLNLSFLVLTCKAILWQKSNLSNRKDSCSMFIMNLRHCFESAFYLFVCKQLFGFSAGQWAALTAAFVWDSQVKELHFTAPSLKQHCTQLQDKRCECV